MKKGRSNRSKLEEVFVFPLALHERTALWITLDLLNFVKPSSHCYADYRSIQKITDMLFDHKGKDSVIELELRPNFALIAANAVDMAVLYLNGIRKDFDAIPPQYSRILTELNAYEPIIRNLQNRFKQCVKYFCSSQ